MRTLQSIDNILNLVIIEEVNHKFHNRYRTFTYCNIDESFSSYDTEIAKKIDNIWVVYGKTKKYGDYISNTTSSHVMNLIRFLQFNQKEFIIWSVLKPETVLNNCLEYTDLNQADECPITLEKIKKGIKTPCNHKFDSKAFKKAISTDYRCPLCRQSVLLPIIQNIIQDI